MSGQNSAKCHTNELWGKKNKKITKRDSLARKRPNSNTSGDLTWKGDSGCPLAPTEPFATNQEQDYSKEKKKSHPDTSSTHLLPAVFLEGSFLDAHSPPTSDPHISKHQYLFMLRLFSSTICHLFFGTSLKCILIFILTTLVRISCCDIRIV